MWSLKDLTHTVYEKMPKLKLFLQPARSTHWLVCFLCETKLPIPAQNTSFNNHRQNFALLFTDIITQLLMTHKHDYQSYTEAIANIQSQFSEHTHTPQICMYAHTNTHVCAQTCTCTVMHAHRHKNAPWFPDNNKTCYKKARKKSCDQIQWILQKYVR